MTNYDYYLVYTEETISKEILDIRSISLPIKNIYNEKGSKFLKNWLAGFFGKYPMYQSKLLYKVKTEDDKELENKVNNALSKKNLSAVEEEFSKIAGLTKVDFDEPYKRFNLGKRD